MAYGTLTTLDTLATLNNTTVAEIGEDTVWAGIQAALDAHNMLLREAMMELVDDTTDRQRRYGGSDSGEMDEVDEMGRADASKLSAGTTVGFPLRKYQRTKQWTRDFFEEVTGAQFAAEVNGDLDADARLVYRQIRRAIFTPTNTTFTDTLVDQVSLAVKALVNADSAEIPNGPHGETFNAATHTHYLYTAGTSLVAADLTALIETVVEHYSSGMPIVEINRAQEATVRALTGFAAYQDARIIVGSATTIAQGNLDPININDRAIGVYNGAEIRVKPRIPAGYLFAWVQGAPKPLVYRRPLRNPARGDFRLVADNELYPLRAQTRERMFGVAPWNRTNGAALYIDTGAAGAYVAPTIS